MSNTVVDDDDTASEQDQKVLDKISSLLQGPSASSTSASQAIVLEDVAQTRTVHEEEILLINGVPIRLPAENSDPSATSDGADVVSIRNALRAGEIPSIVVLNRIIKKLHESNPIPGMVVAIETSLTVSNCRKTTEKCVVQPIVQSKEEEGAVPWEMTEERVERQLYSSKTVEMSESFAADCSLPREKHCWASGSVDSGQWTETDVQESKPSVDPSFTKPDDLLLHYTEGNLMSGSLEGLLTHFTPSPTYFPDRPFIFTFLLAARQFIRPDEILDKVMKSTLANGGTNNLPYLLSTWMNDFPYDFRDERMIRMVRDFTEQSTESERNCYKERNTLSRALRRLANRLTKLEKYELEKTQLQKLKFSVDEWRTAQPLVEIAGGSPMQMANTLTAIEVERFSFIGLEEFFPPPYVSSYRGGVSNLLAYVQWYNRLTYVVATDILRSPRKRHRARAVEFWIETGRECFNRGNFNSLMAIIATLTGGPIGRLKKTWTKVTSSSSSLLSGMTSSSMISSAGGMGGNSSACSSAAGGGRQQLAILEHQADPTNNFATYRATLQAAAWRSCPSHFARSSSTSSSQSSKQHSSCSSDNGQSSNTKKESTIAVLPFFSLLLKDLHFLNETSGSTMLDNGHVNYEKWRQLSERLSEIRRWQRRSSYQRRCRLGRRHKSVTTEIHSLREAIERGPIIGDKDTNSLEKTKGARDNVDSTKCADDGERGAAALAKVSYEREAPDGAVEKAHWKTLQQYHP